MANWTKARHTKKFMDYRRNFQGILMNLNCIKYDEMNIYF